MWHKVMDRKMSLNGFMVNLLFYRHITICWEKLVSSEKVSHNLTYELRFVWKISAFKCYKMVEFSKISVEMIISKHFACPKQRTAWRKLFIPQQIKASCVSGTNIFWWRFIGINRHLISKCFENAVLAGLEMVQWKCFF